MPEYAYKCRTCEFVESRWDNMSEMKQWIKCGECGKRSYRHLAGQYNLVLVKNPAIKRTMHDVDATKIAKEGQESLVDDTKEALKAKSGISPYSKLTLTDKGIKEFKGRKMTDKEKRRADEARAMIVRDAAEGMSKKQKEEVIDRVGDKQDSI